MTPTRGATTAQRETQGAVTPAAIRAELAALEGEQAGLPAAIKAAQQAVDAPEWLRLLNRQDALPGEIEAVRLRLVATELEPAWVKAEQAAATEADRLVVLEELRAEMAEFTLDNKLPIKGPGLEPGAGFRVRTPDALAAFDAAAEAKRQEVRAAERKWKDAQDATGKALAVVEGIEARLDAAGMEVPEGEGFRARPLRLAKTIAVGVSGYPAFVEEIATLAGHEGASVVSLLAGQVPPRWVAVRCAAHVFEQPVSEVAA